MGAAASTALIPPEYASMPEERKLVYKTKFLNITEKVMPFERDNAEKQAVSSLTVEYLNELIDSGSPFSIDLKLLEETIEGVIRKSRTPIIVDNSESDNVNTFFSYRNAIMVDGKKMGIDKSLRKIPVPDIMEETRKKLVTAIKLGCPLIIAMTKSVTDFATAFNDESASSASSNPLNTDNGNKMFLPKLLFNNAGRELIKEEYMNKLFRDDEKEHGFAFSRNPDGFRVILTSAFSAENVDEYLFGNDWGLPKPKEQYQFIYIDQDPKPPIPINKLDDTSHVNVGNNSVTESETDIGSNADDMQNVHVDNLAPQNASIGESTVAAIVSTTTTTASTNGNSKPQTAKAVTATSCAIGSGSAQTPKQAGKGTAKGNDKATDKRKKSDVNVSASGPHQTKKV